MKDQIKSSDIFTGHLVVSMTSFPAAITYAYTAIKSLLAGSVIPDKIILYVVFSQFKDGKLPQDIMELAAKNPVFEIRNYDDDLRSYKKLIPALQDFPESVILTVDDDVRYNRDLVKKSLEWHLKYPNAILAHRAKKILPGKPYKKWKKYRWYHFLFKRIHFDNLNLMTGVAGVLYPPHALKEDMLDPALFKTIAPTTDDIWFWGAAVAKGTPILPIPFGYNKPHGIGKPATISLKTSNFKKGEDKNSKTLRDIISHFPAIREKIAE